MAILDQAWVGWTLLCVGGVLCVWALFWDRARGRKRCRRCQYDMHAAVVDEKGACLCPECGARHTRAKQLLRTRRRWRWAKLGALLMLGAYAWSVAPGVRDRGWVAAVPTWVLVLGPMEVSVGSTSAYSQVRRHETVVSVQTGWPAPLSEEYGDWCTWSPRGATMSWWRPATGVDRPPPNAVLRSIWSWRLERRLRAQGVWFDEGMLLGPRIVATRVDIADLLDASQDGWAIQAGGTPGGATKTLEELRWDAADEFFEGLRTVTSTLAERRGFDEPGMTARVLGDEVWVCGTCNQVSDMLACLASVRRIYAARRRGEHISDALSTNSDLVLIARAIPDVLLRIHTKLGPQQLEIDTRFTVWKRWNALERYDQTSSPAWLVRSAIVMIHMQTQAQREAMDADLAAWRKELGLVE